MNNGGLMGGLYVLSEWIMRFSVVNILWIIFNLPIVFLIFNMFFVEQIEEIFIFMIPLALLSPILLFPATTAMFASVRDWIMNNEGHGGILRSFWQYYKENYKRSLLGGLILIGIWVILIADIYYFMNQNTIMMYVFGIMGIILYVCTINFFSVTVHYHMKLFASLKNAFLITIGSPILFSTLIISSGVVLYISTNVFQFLLVFFTCSLVAFLSFAAFYRNYLKMIERK